jgi:hypothetical protein
MQRPPVRRILLTALLLALAMPAARAEGPSPSRGAGGFAALLDLLDRVRGGLISLWAENGAVLDPSGGPTPDQEGDLASGNGCGIDPDGRCAAAQERNLASDNGCGIDPSGGCQLPR